MCGSSKQRADQVGRGDFQLPDGKPDGPLPAAELGEDAAVVGLQPGAGPGVGPRDARQDFGVAGGLARDGQRSGGELEVEVRLGRGQQRVVGRDLDPGLVRGDDSPHDLNAVDRVGEPQHPAQAVQRGKAAPGRRGGKAVGQAGRRAQEQRAAVDRLNLAVDRLDLAVEAIIGRPGEQAGQPEPAGLIQVAEGLQDLLPRGGDVQVARTRQAQGVGQVDRLDHLAGDQGRRESAGRLAAGGSAAARPSPMAGGSGGATTDGGRF